jgi:hypothetical protein
MNWLDKLLKLDRRIIFLAMGAAIVIPLIAPLKMPVGVQKSTQAMFDTVEQIDRTRQALMISIDYDPQTEAECQPMTIALLRHAFARRIPVAALALYVQGNGLLSDAIQRTMAEFNSRAKSPADSIVYGRDVVFLGWQPPPIVPILSMGESIAKVFPVDYYGTKIETLPIMSWLKSYDQVGMVAAVSSGSSPLWYVVYAQPQFGVKVGAACTAVSAPDYYPYFETKQLCGMLGGMKGAAEYEDLVATRLHIPGRGRAMEGMGAQSAAHILIMAFVILGNVAYFVGKRRAR